MLTPGGCCMTIPDEILAAYVDGELGGAERARVERAIARDARLAQRVAQQRAQRERRNGAVEQSLPQRLPHAGRRTGAAGPAQIIDLASVRAERARRGNARSPRSRRFPMAAALLAGLALGVLIARLSTSSSLGTTEA